MELSENLLKLAKEYSKHKAKLYVVGGAVRNSMMGLPIDDIDICGQLDISKMALVVAKCGFRSQEVNAALGTLLITVNDNESYEYTVWRKEMYLQGHTPNKVQFVKDLKIDARRRDFTINCIYYDIISDKIIDIYNAANDLKHKKLRTIETPQIVFSSDGLRILRLVRFACELGFNVDKLTLKTAKDYCHMLQDISAERKLKELKLILFGNFRYGNHNNRCVKLFNYLDIYKYLFKRTNFKIKNNKYAKKVFKTKLNIRYFAFVVLMLLNLYKFKSMPKAQVEYDIHVIFGKAGFNESNANVQQIINTYMLVQKFMFEKTIHIMDLVDYDKANEIVKDTMSVFVNTNKIQAQIYKLKQLHIPFCEEELDITNEQLKELVEENKIAKTKRLLFNLCLSGKVKNQYDILKDVVAKLNK